MHLPTLRTCFLLIYSKLSKANCPHFSLVISKKCSNFAPSNEKPFGGIFY